MTESIKQTAGRIYDILAPWDRADTTPDEIAEQIQSDPAAVINFLIDMIEN